MVGFPGQSQLAMVATVMTDSMCQLHGLYSPWNSPDQNTGVGSLSLLQGIFPTQGSNPGLPHCRWILYQLSYEGSPKAGLWHPDTWLNIILDVFVKVFVCFWMRFAFKSVDSEYSRLLFIIWWTFSSQLNKGWPFPSKKGFCQQNPFWDSDPSSSLHLQPAALPCRFKLAKPLQWCGPIPSNKYTQTHPALLALFLWRMLIPTPWKTSHYSNPVNPNKSRLIPWAAYGPPIRMVELASVETDRASVTLGQNCVSRLIRLRDVRCSCPHISPQAPSPSPLLTTVLLPFLSTGSAKKINNVIFIWSRNKIIMILLYSRHNYPPQFADKKQAKRRLRTCPRLHSKQQSEPSDPGLRPKLEAHQADLEEIVLKIPFSGTQSDLLISNKDDNNGLLQTARGTVTVHCIGQAVHMWNSSGFSSRMTILSPQPKPNILHTAVAKAVNLKVKSDPGTPCLNPSGGLRTSCISLKFAPGARRELNLQTEIKWP